MCRGNKDSTARGFTTVRDLPFLIHEFIFLFLPDSEFCKKVKALDCWMDNWQMMGYRI